MQGLTKIRRTNPALAQAIEERGGFLVDTDFPQIVEIDRFTKVLVRCGNGRFVCPAQDAVHFIEVVDASGKDYVRDASLLADNCGY